MKELLKCVKTSHVPVFPLLSVCLVVPGDNKCKRGYKVGHMDKLAVSAGMNNIMREIKYLK